MKSPTRDLIGFFRRNRRMVLLPFLLMFAILFMSTLHDGLNYNRRLSPWKGAPAGEPPSLASVLNSRYHLQQSLLKYSASSSRYDIAIIADMDKASRKDKEWGSVLKRGQLQRDTVSGTYSVSWDSETVLLSSLNEDGRAMELSELVYFAGRLLTFDDRTGIVFEIHNDEAIPVHILMNGHGKTSKGFKTEWATVKDDLLYVGSTGKEWTADGVVINNHPMWVKTIDKDGRIAHHDWSDVYERLRSITGTQYPGYLLHEAVNFNHLDRRWYFLPRRVSTEAYDDKLDESRGSNVVISCDENMRDMRVSHLGPHIKTHGFSSFKFLPWRETELVALKTEENGDRIATYITVLDLDGRVLLEETEIATVKYEGLEIL